MKFAFMVVTRGNPLRASAVIEVAKSLASGKHEISYIVGCDDDDPETVEFFRKRGIAITEGPRPIGLGSVWNRCVETADADIYCPFPDDSFIALPDWDERITSLGLSVLGWNDLANPGQCTLPIVSRDWIKLTGKLYDERFPFWFYDTCVDELHSFVCGSTIVIPSDMVLAAKKGLTQNLRDLSFWWDFYVSTRAERLFLAANIRKQLGIQLDQARLSDILSMWEARDKIGRESAKEIEKALSAGTMPSPQYLRAKAHAEAYVSKAKSA